MIGDDNPQKLTQPPSHRISTGVSLNSEEQARRFYQTVKSKSSMDLDSKPKSLAYQRQQRLIRGQPLMSDAQAMAMMSTFDRSLRLEYKQAVESQIKKRGKGGKMCHSNKYNL